jgi:hypothetical protein
MTCDAYRNAGRRECQALVAAGFASKMKELRIRDLRGVAKAST